MSTTRQRTIRGVSVTSILMISVLLAGCDTMNPREGDIALSGEEVTKLISGNTLRSAWEGQQLTIVYYENGVVRGTHGLTGSDSGTWTVEEDTYCHRWVRYFSATRHCYKWWQRPSDYLLQNVDSFRARNLTGRIVAGKPPGF